MAKKSDVAGLQAEVAALRTEVDRLSALVAAERHEVTTSVTGPRLSEVFVDAQVVPMTGQYSRSGKKELELERPTVDVYLALKGLRGTDTELKITINGKTKKETLTTTKSKEFHSFTYPFSDFGL